jgi:hypothetical protein
MNIFLWILQVVLALHTAMGAVWKLTNPEQTIPTLSAIPHGVWIALSILELLCTFALFSPLLIKGSRPKLVPIGALVIAAEMVLFSVLNLASAETDVSSIGYWMVVATLSGFLAYGRLKLKPLN